jgi:hypothetical protein
MKKITPVISANIAQTASLGSLPLKLGALFAGAGLLVAVGMAGALMASPALAVAGSLGALCVLLAGAVMTPMLLDRSVRQPLSALSHGMMVLTPETANAIVKMAERPDAVGEVARASVALLEKHDHVEGIARGVREAQGFARDLARTADLLKQGQTQIAQGLVGTADELEALRRTVSNGQADISDVYARAARDAERGLDLFGSVRADLAAAADHLQRETSAIAAQRALMAAGVETVTHDLNAATRLLETHVEALGPDGHDVRGALVDIADRRASFVQTIETATLAATRLDDVLRRVDERVGATLGDAGTLRASIEALGPKLDETLHGVQLVGRSLPEAARLLSSGIESIETSVNDSRQSIEDRLAAIAPAPVEPAEGQQSVLNDLSHSAELFKEIIAANTASIVEFQAAFDLMRADVGDLRQSFVPVVTDVQETLDRSVEALAALERVSVDIGSMQGAVVPMVEEVKLALDRTVETLAGLERVTADMDRTAKGAPVAHDASAMQAVQPGIDQAQKLLVGFRIITRSLGEQVEALKTKVAAFEVPAVPEAAGPGAGLGAEVLRRFDLLDGKLADLAASGAAGMRTHHGEVLPPTQDFGPEQQSFQRLLAGFRILMRNISTESERLQASVSKIAHDSEGVAGRVDSMAAPHSDRLETMLGAMGEMVVQLGERVRDGAPQAGRSAAGSHMFDAQQAGFERVLVGFRLLMRDLGQEADKLRGALSVMPDGMSAGHEPGAAVVARVDHQMQALNASLAALMGDLEARMASPINAAADNIGHAVAESLASLEQRLAEPVHLMIDTAKECAVLLRDVKKALAEAPASPAAAALVPATQGHPAARITEVTDRVDRWIDEVDGTINDLSENLSDARNVADPKLQKALDQRIGQLTELAVQMRRETSEFIAVGAAISRDLDDTTDAEPPRKAAASSGMGGLFGRKKR